MQDAVFDESDDESTRGKLDYIEGNQDDGWFSDAVSVTSDDDTAEGDEHGSDANEDSRSDEREEQVDRQALRDFYVRHFISKDVDEYLQSTNMSPDKNLAVSLMRKHFMALHDGVTEDYKAPVLLITGGPGVGKSFLVDVVNGVSTTIDELSKQLRMALFGVAAVNIDGASLCSLMDIPIEYKKNDQCRVKPWDENKLRRFKQMFDLDKIWSIVIDEISTVKPYMLGYLNARLQHACGSSAPFGGKSVVLLGDFDQLPPAGGPSLPEVAMMIQKEKYMGNRVGHMTRNKKHFEITSVVRQGVELFTKATHIRLQTQNRSEDEAHTRLLQKMCARGTISHEDLKEYKSLSQDDKEFEFATILTPGNRERHEFNNIQARRWAKQHKTNVIRWKRRIQEKSWKGKPSNPANVARVMEESCFWELFVPMALAYLTFNLNTNKKMANGVPVRYHSMSFVDPEAQQRFEELLESAAPGGVITLQQPPDIINVELFPNRPGDDDNTRRKNEENRRAWRDQSITDDGTVVIPIEISHKKSVKWKNSSIRGGGGLRYYPSKVLLADYFPIEPGFSVTIHKAQGRTIPKVVLSISEHPFHFTRLTWEGLYVALSRVRHKDDIRLLLRFDDRSTMEYIANLKKNKFVKSYFDGYRAERITLEGLRGINDDNGIMPERWSGKMASISAGFLDKNNSTS
ncbi:hypothetical protein ACHAWF_015363 [Thalassiosira exigua]